MTTWSQIISDLQDKEKGNMTQQEIAESVHCSQNYISDLKKGKKENAFPMKLHKD